MTDNEHLRAASSTDQASGNVEILAPHPAPKPREQETKLGIPCFICGGVGRHERYCERLFETAPAAELRAEIERLRGLLDSNFGSGWEDFDRAKFSALRATIEQQRAALALAVPALELGIDALRYGYQDSAEKIEDALSAVREALGPVVNQENPK